MRNIDPCSCDIGPVANPVVHVCPGFAAVTTHSDPPYHFAKLADVISPTIISSPHPGHRCRCEALRGRGDRRSAKHCECCQACYDLFDEHLSSVPKLISVKSTRWVGDSMTTTA